MYHIETTEEEVMEHSKFVNMVTDAINKLETQGELSKQFHNDQCAYQMIKDSKKLCCVVGFMMPSDDVRLTAESFDTNCNGTGISSLFEYGFYWAKQFTKEQINLLTELQSTHDNIFDNLVFDAIISKMRNRIADYSYFLR